MTAPLRIASKQERGPRRRRRRPQPPKRGAFIAFLEPTKDPRRFGVIAICLKEKDETYTSKALTLRQIDALERIWCINCDREHRLIGYWEALGARLFRARPGFLKPKLGPRPAIMESLPLPWTVRPRTPDPAEQ